MNASTWRTVAMLLGGSAAERLGGLAWTLVFVAAALVGVTLVVIWRRLGDISVETAGLQKAVKELHDAVEPIIGPIGRGTDD